MLAIAAAIPILFAGADSRAVKITGDLGRTNCHAVMIAASQALTAAHCTGSHIEGIPIRAWHRHPNPFTDLAVVDLVAPVRSAKRFHVQEGSVPLSAKEFRVQRKRGFIMPTDSGTPIFENGKLIGILVKRIVERGYKRGYATNVARYSAWIQASVVE